ncbi:MAG: D-glycero-D-manno-heptose 1,7-bisphosphate phosphatase [Thermoleophilaceae bacterium]|nr:D-glycero-D-manno-heptose 1,7-bisphosphate phosphatase [Thermoleophilaceae bacterium]
MRAGRAGDRLSLSAVFLDRDGVVNRKAPEGDYVTSWTRFEFLPGALEGLRLLAEAGPPVVLATNQRGIARGRMSEADLTDIHERMTAAVAAAGGRIDAIYHCPHEGGCDCRKPGTGLFERAARDLGIELSASAVIGDRASDMEAAARIGALRLLVGDSEEQMPPVDHVAQDLPAAVRWLLDQRLRASAISE